MKTREEVEQLKRDWIKDGCWDLEKTEGFEEYHGELKLYAENVYLTVRVDAMKKHHNKFKELVGMGISAPLAEHLMVMDSVIDSIIDRVTDLEKQLVDLK